MLLLRPSSGQDLASLAEVEISAAQRFHGSAGLGWIADRPPTAADIHSRHMATGTHWLAELHGQVVGFVFAENQRPDLHVWELSVRLERQDRGIGSALLNLACAHASEQGFGGVTLTTFRDLAWNGPFYQKRGFVEVPTSALGTRLTGILARERMVGLPPQRRCAMRKIL